MKIIWKRKDYYDYVAGEFWIDEKAVFNREIVIIDKTIFWDYSDPWPRAKKWSIFSIAFCWEIITWAFYEGRFHFGEDIDEKKLDSSFTESNRSSHYDKMSEVLKKIHWEETDLNDRLWSPIVLLWNHRTYYNEKDIDMFVSKSNSHYELLPTHKNIVLKDFWIDKFIPAKEAFAKINNYLLRVPEIKSIQSNEWKIESHWFDLKQSFRHRKNKIN